jgi:hypothetical protein
MRFAAVHESAFFGQPLPELFSRPLNLVVDDLPRFRERLGGG